MTTVNGQQVLDHSIINNVVEPSDLGAGYEIDTYNKFLEFKATYDAMRVHRAVEAAFNIFVGELRNNPVTTPNPLHPVPGFVLKTNPTPDEHKQALE